MRVAVVGGGISGLSAAHSLRRAGAEVRLFEASGSVGGTIGTIQRGDYRFECGPVGVQGRAPEFRRLAEEVGIADEIVAASPAALHRYLYFGGSLHRLPKSFREFVRSGLFTSRQKLRACLEMFVPKSRPDREETVAEFFGRRLGRGITMTWIDVVVSGVYAGHPNRLGIQSAFPDLCSMEQDYGSLLRGVRNRTRAKVRETLRTKASPLLSFPEGLSRLTDRLGEELGSDLRPGHRATSLERDGAGYRLTFDVAGRDPVEESFDRVILAVSPERAAMLLSSLGVSAADLLFEVDTSSLAVVHAGFDASEVPGLPDGYGLLVPRSMRMRTMGWMFYSNVFPDAAPEGKVALIGCIGGAIDEAAMDLDDATVRHLMMGELGLALGQRRTPQPEEFGVVRWRDAIPQYNVGHRRRVEAVTRLLAMEAEGVSLAGSWVGGVFVEDCIRRGRVAAEEVLGEAVAATDEGSAP